MAFFDDSDGLSDLVSECSDNSDGSLAVLSNTGPDCKETRPLVVNMLCGVVARLEVPLHPSVAQVKQMLATELNIPASEQRILVGNLIKGARLQKILVES